ncbi:hypothetical protein GUJ93_ZPchr0008g12036 [Zizania palustris]|uniref:Uncharacterized protein n=1 Tax=Zizania palustris TaxID=103762 RepID=A0A8J5R6J7_ZIZPA|nr:hypothetical protein GUJ93_ZPchr0008g12036 [Zizania palustris]
MEKACIQIYRRALLSSRETWICGCLRTRLNQDPPTPALQVLSWLLLFAKISFGGYCLVPTFRASELDVTSARRQIL